ncbi:hypothetical protein MTX78_06625 [Hymenobacter tibetensis]|uniref:Uncharacterized protein n=1 Tax=Hymenobacter tibetensis TaxID=497967 RepID=A0ABY4D8B8_9BACT|nr:hypothetical protein [Hymenobacter tibetensis]UOG76268.1 hypothetical protein MTX78_06625 [Hymenobacter tibetensis]
MKNHKAESVHTITNWYDGAREGVTDFQGKPHYYACLQDYDYEGKPTPYRLTPIDEETFRLELENWDIWLRYEAAFKSGEATRETHLALPEDQARHEEINRILLGKEYERRESTLIATGEFAYGEKTTVVWDIQ